MYLAFPLLNQPESRVLFEKAYRKFYVERSAFYFEHFEYESPFETYRRYQHLHKPTHFPFVIALLGDLNLYDKRVRDFENPFNLLTTFKNGDGTGLPFVEEKIAPIHRFSYYSLGSREKEDILMKSQEDDFVRSHVFYLLPEDYHYFVDLHPYFREQGFTPFKTTISPKINL